MLRNLKPKWCVISKPSLVCGSQCWYIVFGNKESWTSTHGGEGAKVVVVKQKKNWKCLGRKAEFGKRERENHRKVYSLRLHEETRLEIRVGTQPRAGQDREPGTAGRPQVGRGSTDEGAQGRVSEKERSTRSKGRERPGMKVGLPGQDKAESWGVDGRVGAQWTVFPFRHQISHCTSGIRKHCESSSKAHLIPL